VGVIERRYVSRNQHDSSHGVVIAHTFRYLHPMCIHIRTYRTLLVGYPTQLPTSINAMWY